MSLDTGAPNPGCRTSRASVQLTTVKMFYQVIVQCLDRMASFAAHRAAVGTFDGLAV